MESINNATSSSYNINEVKQCPFLSGAIEKAAGRGTTIRDWWPNQLKLNILRQHSSLSNPMDEDFDYEKEFNSLDLEAVKKDLFDLMTDSQDWWPADYGHYGPFFIRLAWHSAGTYRMGDGRGGAGSGMQRFAPLNSWPDNGNLDKGRQLLWPIKQKYGNKISWGDLMILVGNCALESMGFKTLGFAGGRKDVWEPEEDTYWGSETEWLGNDKRFENGELEQPLGATHHGLIYVNPQGPNDNPDPVGSAKNIRETFGRMAMDDYETVALVAGGHTFGKAHGAADPDQYLSPEPAGASIEEQGLGWKNSFGSGHGDATITSGIEGAWTPNPTQWDHDYFKVLLGHEWERTKSPAGAHQWRPTDDSNAQRAPMAGDPTKTQEIMMTTADMALKVDPEYRKIAEYFQNNTQEFEEAFAKAWYKLTHRDMGPIDRYLGPDVPKEQFIWQDPVPKVDHALVDINDISDLKNKILNSELSIAELVSTAWASASTFRGSDFRGGANGARIRLDPQKNWEVNNPPQLQKVLSKLTDIQSDFNSSQSGNKKISLADLIVLAGSVAVEQAAKNAGTNVSINFKPGRTDASAEQTETPSFEALEPKADGFRNYIKPNQIASAEDMLIDRAQLLTLTAPEMTVLIGGLRVLNTNYDHSDYGVFTNKKETLSNDFFKNLLDISIAWNPVHEDKTTFEGKNRKTGELVWKATRVDLIFGSNAELRAIAEVYGSSDSEEKFIRDFAKAWEKVMQLDRFDLN